MSKQQRPLRSAGEGIRHLSHRLGIVPCDAETFGSRYTSQDLSAALVLPLLPWLTMAGVVVCKDAGAQGLLMDN